MKSDDFDEILQVLPDELRIRESGGDLLLVEHVQGTLEQPATRIGGLLRTHLVAQ